MTTMHIERPAGPVLKSLGENLSRVHEWYPFEESPGLRKGFGVPATLDEDTDSPQMPLHLAELEGGIAWAAGLEGTGCSQ